MSKKVKPKYLYHGSLNKKIKIFRPRSKTLPRNWNKGPVVFATNEFVRALKFIIPTDDSWTAMGAFNGEHHIVVSDKKRFISSDKSGAVYYLPSDKFKYYKKGEWYSKNSVKPIKKNIIENGMEEMIKSGVRIFFTDKKTLERIQKAKDHGLSILNNLESENERWGHEIEKLDIYKGSKKRISS